MAVVECNSEVEIAPGRWLAVKEGDTVSASDLSPERKDPHQLSPTDALKQFLSHGASSGGGAAAERSSLAFEWDGKQVRWRGKEIPVTLREQDGTLYMIGFNRENPRKTRFVFLKLNAKGTGFVKVSPQDFPKQVATQNMWLQGSRFEGVGNEWIDTWQVLRQLDIGSPYFGGSMTAHIWYQLVEGVEDFEMPFLIPSAFLEDYVARHNPIALPTLVRDERGSAGGGEGRQAPGQNPEADGANAADQNSGALP
jgi:hypothetical protein